MASRSMSANVNKLFEWAGTSSLAIKQKELRPLIEAESVAVELEIYCSSSDVVLSCSLR